MSLTVTAALVASLLSSAATGAREAPLPSRASDAHYTPMGKEVACTDWAKRITGKNLVGGTLWWFQLDASWCWDHHMVITRGYAHVSEDTPGICWSYQGEGQRYSEGGKGHGTWTVTRSGKFKCGIGSASFFRYPALTIKMTGGGASE